MKSLARLLRPLVRLMVRSGITFPVFADLVRALYVEVALRDALADSKARTDSRVSLLTGVHRKEIRRLRELKAAPGEVPEVVTRGSQIVARWLATPGATDRNGDPLPLPRAKERGDPRPSFDEIVESVTKDVRPRAVLDEWLLQGVASIDAEERVVLNVAAFVPRPGAEEQLFYFARNLHDHVAAASANVEAAGRAPFLDRSVHYDRLTPELAAVMEALGRDGARKLLVEVNRNMLEKLEAEERAGAASGGPTRRVNVGVYVYVEDERENLAP